MVLQIAFHCCARVLVIPSLLVVCGCMFECFLGADDQMRLEPFLRELHNSNDSTHEAGELLLVCWICVQRRHCRHMWRMSG